ncbi:hypothetical protein [Halodesulfovibrio aestuarii]|uniref:hypothetical protein n=1 Tax=Halodesulfovibrio aestuarii TaxID=126333 RepID=UPI003D3577F3
MAKKKKDLVWIEIRGEKGTGILHGGEFVGQGEPLDVDEQTANNLIARGRAKLYVKSEAKKK